MMTDSKYAPGDLVRVVDSTLDPVYETLAMVGGYYYVDDVCVAGFIRLGIWEFNPADLEPVQAFPLGDNVNSQCLHKTIENPYMETG